MLMQVASILIAGGGSFALMKGPFPMSNFFIAGTLVYMGTIVLEGVSMSLTSKVRLRSRRFSRASSQRWVGVLHVQCPCTCHHSRLAVGRLSLACGLHLGMRRTFTMKAANMRYWTLSSMSPLQVIDERMSKGLWNAGLLSTQAGTIGRLCGNLLLSLCARITGAMDMDQINAFARLLYGLGGSTMVVSLAYVFSVFGRLLG